MKIRTGFVSNSSSSSFCILGFKIKEESITREEIATKLNLASEEEIQQDENLLYDVIDKADIFFADHQEAGAPKGYTLIGINIANGIIDDNEGYMETEIPLKEANKRIKDIAKVLKIKEPLKIISGTRIY